MQFPRFPHSGRGAPTPLWSLDTQALEHTENLHSGEMKHVSPGGDGGNGGGGDWRRMTGEIGWSHYTLK